MCLPKGDNPNYVYGGGADPKKISRKKEQRFARKKNRAPRDVSLDFKSRPPPVQDPEYAPDWTLFVLLNS